MNHPLFIGHSVHSRESSESVADPTRSIIPLDFFKVFAFAQCPGIFGAGIFGDNLIALGVDRDIELGATEYANPVESLLVNFYPTLAG